MLQRGSGRINGPMLLNFENDLKVVKAVNDDTEG